MKIHKTDENILWTNPKPVLRSRHSCYPYLSELDDGTIMASHQIAEAFESVDGTTRLSVSRDKGLTWELLPEFYDKSAYPVPTSDTLKITNLGGGSLLMFGYEFLREDPETELGNPETGGLLEDRIILMRSFDTGKSWSAAEEVECRWGRHVEASAPITVLANGHWVSPIAEFPKWDGTSSGEDCGRLLRSEDRGKTWNDDTVTMSLGKNIQAYEQRLCQLERSGRIVAIAWNENTVTGELHNNHYAVSSDSGITFDGPYDTGVRGQTASVCAIGEDRLLALHAVRRDSDRPGVYAYIVNLENGEWEIEAGSIIWEPDTPVVKNENMAEIFAYLRFGQPSAIKLSDGTILATMWNIEQGQGKTIVIRLKIE